MRAVRFHGARDIRVDQIDEPVCGEDEVKVCIARPRYSCGTVLLSIGSG